MKRCIWDCSHLHGSGTPESRQWFCTHDAATDRQQVMAYGARYDAMLLTDFKYGEECRLRAGAKPLTLFDEGEEA